MTTITVLFGLFCFYTMLWHWLVTHTTLRIRLFFDEDYAPAWGTLLTIAHAWLVGLHTTSL